MRKFHSLLFVITSAVAAFAAPVSLNQAKTIASACVQAHAVKAPTSALTLALQAQNEQGLTDFYVFNRAGGNGYVIVSGDDHALPVLGYSDSGAFVDGQMPCGLEYLLEVYSAEMDYLRNHPEVEPRRAASRPDAVTPMLTSNWSQDAPYNNLVPSIGNQRCYTGCVATAIAQVMHYYQWPLQGTGSKSYKWKYTLNGQSVTQTLSANFAQSAYDWANMLETYTAGNYNDTQAAAVALLLKDVGYAVSMTYGTSSSGAADTQQAVALRNYFSYPEATWERHVNYEQTDWEEMIFNEIAAGRPVVFNGATPTGSGHSFVVDGYDNQGLVHVNWGWAGQSNGYFAISSMMPSSPGIGGAPGGYSLSQTIVTHINKLDPDNAEVYHKGFANAFYPVKASVALGDTVAATRFANYQVNGYGVNLANLYAVARVYNETETEVIYDYENKSNGSMVQAALYNWSTNFSPRADLTVGKYHIKGGYKLDQNAEVVEYVRPLDSLNYVLMEVKEDGIAYFSSPKAEPQLLLLEAHTNNVKAGEMLPVVATIKNTGIAYTGNLVFTLAKPVAESASLLNEATEQSVMVNNVTIRRSEQQDITVELPTDGLQPGSYVVTVTDKDGKPIGEGIDVTLGDPTTGVSQLKTDAHAVVVKGNSIIVNGANRVAVYDMAGRMVGRNATTAVPQGIYVVVADGKAVRVNVR